MFPERYFKYIVPSELYQTELNCYDVVRLGAKVIGYTEQEVEGELVQVPVLSETEFLVDVLWNKAEDEPEEWVQYRVIPTSDPHQHWFGGLEWLWQQSNQIEV
jgi:hypothetical protein